MIVITSRLMRSATFLSIVGIMLHVIVLETFFCIRRRSGNVRGIPRGDYIRDSVPQEPITRKEPATTRYSFHRVLTDRSIFSLNLSRIQIPTGHMNPSDQLQSEARTSVDMST